MFETNSIGSSNTPYRHQTVALILVSTSFMPLQTSVEDKSIYEKNNLRGVNSSRVEEPRYTGTLHVAESNLSRWSKKTHEANWQFEIAERIKLLASKENGWKGEGSLAALPEAKVHALSMLRKLVQEDIDRRPSIGLDYEGTFSFNWVDDVINIDLTIYDDGSYSFFASNKEQKASVDDAKLSDPLDCRLLGILLS